MQHYAEGLIVNVLNLRRRRWLILAILLFVSSGSGIAYSIWDRQTVDVGDNVIDIGVGTVLTVSETVNPEPGMTLVPYGAFLGDHDFDEYVYTYQVRLNKTGRLAVTIVSVRIGEDDALGLVLADVYGETVPDLPATEYNVTFVPTDAGGYVATVNVRIRLSPDASYEQYAAIQGKRITLNLQFRAEALVS